MPGSALDKVPGAYPLFAMAKAVARRPAIEWRASRLNRLLYSQPPPEGLAAAPKDLRPADPEAGRRILAGGFVFAGESLAMGPRGDARAPALDHLRVMNVLLATLFSPFSRRLAFPLVAPRAPPPPAHLGHLPAARTHVLL